MTAALAVAGLGVPASSAAQTIPAGNGTLPGMRFYDAEALTPATAKQNYYDGAGETVSYAWASQKPWEITATAVALENDPQKIFAFVKNYVRFEPRFGAQKGAVGAVIDRSGTAFDQAQLLVELLRAAGHSASYQVGTITLSGTEFVDWIGISNPDAARQFLANGGIPAEVTGSGSISQVTMAHAWVQATINGSTVQLDPSYKRMQRWAPINVASESGLSTASFASPTGAGSENGVAYATAVDLAAIKTGLDAASVTLLGKLKTTYKDKRAEEIYGGERIIAYDDPWSLKTTGTLSAGWGTYSGGLPDKYRTKVTVAAVNCTTQHFADEIYGRRLVFRSIKEVEQGPQWHVQSTGYNAFALNEKSLSAAGCYSTPAVSGVSIAVNLPYAARAGGGAYGSWMDRTTHKQIDLGEDAQIVLGWGDASSELQTRLADDFRVSVPWSVNGSGIPGPGAQEYYGPPMSGPSTGPNGDAKLYASWLAQMTRGAKLLEGVSGTRLQHHYTVGVVYTQVQRQVEDTYLRNGLDDGNEPVVPGSVQDTSTRIDLDSGYSTTSLAGVAADKIAARHTIAGLGAMLEGSMFEQQMDAVDTSSTAQRFTWGQENLASTIRYHLLLPGAGAPQQYREGAVSTQGATCKGLVTANLGYAVIQPNDRYLGPGTTRPWSQGVFNGISPKSVRAPQSDHHMHRGCAWIAFNADASEIAHVVTSVDRELKGAGGPSKRDTNDRAPPAQADLLKDAFKDRSNIGGVDLRTGLFTYRPEPDVVVGQGEFPYALSFQRVFQAGGATCPKCIAGWTHNLDIRATMSGGGLEGMGQTTPLALASPLVGLKAAFDVYRAAPSAIGTHLAAMRTLRWLGDRLTYNVVNVNQGASSETFVRIADGTFAAPPASQSRLVQTGARRQFAETERHGRSPVWLYDPVSFTRTSGAGDVINFGWREWNPTEIPYVRNDYGSVKGFAQGFFATSWTFPQGAALTFTYCEEAPVVYGGEPGGKMTQSLSKPCADRVVRVSNNLGLWIDIDRLNAATSDGRGTFVTAGFLEGANYTDVATPIEQYPYVATGAVDVAGKRRAYEWVLPAAGGRPSSAPLLKRVLAPVDYTGGIVARPDSVLAQSGVAKNFFPLVNDDPKFGLLLVSNTLPTKGTLVKNPDKSFTYTSQAGYSGPDSFTYRVADGSGANAQATVSITVSNTPPPNRPPVAEDVHYVFHRVAGTFPPGVAIADPIARARDDDGDALSFASGGMPADFVPYQGNRLEYKNTAYTYGTPRTYTYKITDGKGGEDTANISVEVPNRAPGAPPVTWEWDVSTGNAWIPIPLSDDDGDTVTIVSTSTPNAVVNSAGNAIRYTNVEVGGYYVFQYTVSDGVNQATGNVDLTVVNSGGCRIGQDCP